MIRSVLLRCCLVLAGAVTVAVAPCAHAAEDSFGDAFWQFRASAGLDYSSGTYGATKTTDVVYSYVSFRAAKGPWTFKAVLPWLDVSGPAVLLDGSAAGTLANGRSRDASGLGDISLAATYSLESLYDRQLYVDFSARLKIPTASYTKGLGTGEVDGALQVDVAQAIGRFMPFITFGYRMDGEPAGYHVRDVLYGTAGLQFNVNDKVATGVLFDYRQAALRAAADPREGTAYVNWRVTRKWSLNVYAVAGFSQNSPSAGGGAVITYRW
jgi:hypothetical protein